MGEENGGGGGGVWRLLRYFATAFLHNEQPSTRRFFPRPIPQFNPFLHRISSLISDPIEAGPGIALYTKEFYEMVSSKLSPDGVFVTQSGSGDVHNFDDCMTAINRTCRSVFSCVAPYTSSVPSFGGNWGFNMAWNGGEEEVRAWKQRTDIDDLIKGTSDHNYYFYDGER